MLAEWALQPVYTVEDVLKGTEFQPKLLVGVGGGATGLINALGEEMGLQVQIPQGAMVANAIGAALSRPTLSAGLRADTTEGFYLIAEEGQKRELPSGFGMKKAESILTEYLRNATAKWNLPDQEVEVISKEFFNTIHGYYDSGEIINLRMQLKPGVLKVNEHEVQVLTGEEDLRKGAERLAEWGVREVLLTLGSQGSIILADGKSYDIPSYRPLHEVDATGCGDTYVMGYIFQRSRGADIPEAGRFAAGVSSIKLEHSGPFCGTTDEVMSLIAKSSK